MTMNNLFASTNAVASTNARSLTGTAQLVAISSSIVEQLIAQLDANAEQYADKLVASQTNNDAMDKLIAELYDLSLVDIDFLDAIDDATLDGMLKSQQSKRSRCKSKAMTIDNYKSMMNASVAENLIRLATGKTKHAGGYSRGTGSVDYTPAQLEAFAADQDGLRKEIRNIQSKKSIMKAKADFDPASERWQALCKAEQMLKDLRVGKSATIVKVDETKQSLTEMLGGVNIEHLKASDSKELLARIAQMIAAEDNEQ